MPLIRYRYNTMCDETPDGAWKWRVILEDEKGQYTDVLVTSLVVNVPSYSREDEMPVVGRKYHMACEGYLTVDGEGIGTIDALKKTT